jgi:hypothetical protein
MNCMKTALLAAAALGLATAAHATGEIIAPVSGVIDVGGPGFGTLAETINQAGLLTAYTSGVTNFDTYVAGNPQHNYGFSGNEWFSNQITFAAQVTYDFGSVVTIDRLALWNEDASGIGHLVLLSGATAFASIDPFNNVINSNYGPQVFSFAPVTTRFVTFAMSRCPQPGSDFTACAIGEVAFRTAGDGVPEPATWTMMIAGFGLAGAFLRRRRITAFA